MPFSVNPIHLIAIIDGNFYYSWFFVEFPPSDTSFFTSRVKVIKLYGRGGDAIDINLLWLINHLITLSPTPTGFEPWQRTAR